MNWGTSDATEVVRQKVWSEHLLKLQTMSLAAARKLPTHDPNVIIFRPSMLTGLVSDSINARPKRFLDKEAFMMQNSLPSVQKAMNRRESDANGAMKQKKAEVDANGYSFCATKKRAAGPQDTTATRQKGSVGALDGAAIYAAISQRKALEELHAAATKGSASVQLPSIGKGTTTVGSSKKKNKKSRDGNATREGRGKGSRDSSRRGSKAAAEVPVAAVAAKNEREKIPTLKTPPAAIKTRSPTLHSPTHDVTRQIQEGLHRSQKAPTAKYDQPLTTAQEYGWLAAPGKLPPIAGGSPDGGSPIRRGPHHGLKSSELTRYAAHVRAVKGQN